MVNDTNTTDPFPEARDIEIVTGVLGAACSFVVIVIILVERVQSTHCSPSALAGAYSHFAAPDSGGSYGPSSAVTVVVVAQEAETYHQ
jgi:hypothetical protein